MQHLLDEVGHTGNVHQRLEQRLVGQFPGLSDTLPNNPHALDVRRHPQDGRDGAQVAGHRLLQCEQFQRALFSMSRFIASIWFLSSITRSHRVRSRPVSACSAACTASAAKCPCAPRPAGVRRAAYRNCGEWSLLRSPPYPKRPVI